MKNKIEHIIWDYNGTLLDHVEYSVRIMNSILNEKSLSEISLENYKENFDFPVKNYYKKLGFDFEKNSFKTIGKEFIKRYNKDIYTNNLHINVLETLEIISNKSITQHVLSARNKKQLNDELKAFKIDSYFKNIKGLDDDSASSKIEKGQELLKLINAPTKNIVLIGDTTHDYEVAKNLEINSILISYGHHSLKKLTKCKVKIIKNLTELHEYL